MNNTQPTQTTSVNNTQPTQTNPISTMLPVGGFFNLDGDYRVLVPGEDTLPTGLTWVEEDEEGNSVCRINESSTLFKHIKQALMSLLPAETTVSLRRDQVILDTPACLVDTRLSAFVASYEETMTEVVSTAKSFFFIVTDPSTESFKVEDLATFFKVPVNQISVPSLKAAYDGCSGTEKPMHFYLTCNNDDTYDLQWV